MKEESQLSSPQGSLSPNTNTSTVTPICQCNVIPLNTHHSTLHNTYTVSSICQCYVISSNTHQSTLLSTNTTSVKCMIRINTINYNNYLHRPTQIAWPHNGVMEQLRHPPTWTPTPYLKTPVRAAFIRMSVINIVYHNTLHKWYGIVYICKHYLLSKEQ